MSETVLAALGTPRRREILRLVWSEERCAGEIHRSLADVSFAAISQHLRVLDQAGLLERRFEGRRRFYRARPERLGPFKPWLQSMWEGALYRLKLRAELEQARRGPRRASRTPRRRKKS